MPHQANTTKATIPRSDRTLGLHPVQRSATLSKPLAQSAVLSPQSGTAPHGPMPHRRPGSGPPAKIPEQSPRLSSARALAPVLSQADLAQSAPSAGTLALPPAVAELSRQQAEPSAEEPTGREA